MTLPAGYSARAMRVDDAGLIAERSGEYTRALLGFAKHSPEDVANYLRDPDFDPATDGWIVFGPDGEYAGSATAMTTGARVNVEALSQDPAIVGWLLDRADQRARETGPGDVVMSLGVIRQDELMPAIVAAHGYAIETSVQRMRITFDGPVPPPAVPHGAVVRRGALDDSSRRAAHAVLTAAFSSQPSAMPRPYAEWVASRDSRSTYDWSQLTTIELDGQAVGVTECNDNFVSTENCGYVGRLAVVPSAQGRGLAKFLLQDAFAVDSAAGRSGTILHVDSSNPTPAVALYTGAGMRPDLISDVWRKTITV